MLWMWFLPRKLDCKGGEYCILKGKHRNCEEQCERKGGTRNRDKICWNVFASHHHQYGKKGGRGEKCLRKCREILVNAYLAPGFLPSRLRRSLMKQFDEEESWTQRVLVHMLHNFARMSSFVRAILVISQICHHLPNRRTLHMGPFATWNWSGSKQWRPAGPWERFNLPYCTCLLQTNQPPLSSSPSSFIPAPLVALLITVLEWMDHLLTVSSKGLLSESPICHWQCQGHQSRIFSEASSFSFSLSS